MTDFRAALATLILATTLVRTSAAARGDADPAVLDQLEAARAVAAKVGDAIWPGFDLRTIPIAVFDDASAVVVQCRATPPGYSKLATERVTTQTFCGPRTEAMNANTSGPLGDDVAAFISRSGLSASGVGAGDVYLLFHESGHAFRARAPAGGAARWPAENASEVERYPEDDAANNAWARLEGTLLRDAIVAEDDAEARRSAQDFLAVRTRRQDALDARVANFEERLELNEGLADYFGVQAVRLASHDGAPEGCGADGRWFRDYLDRLARVSVGGRGAARDRFYLTGAAVALLLDRFAPGWKAALEEDGGTLQDRLAEALAFDDDSAEAASDAVAKRSGFDRVLGEEELASRASRARKRSRLLAIAGSPGVKLVLDLSHAGGAGDVRSFDPMNFVALEPGLKVHTRMLTIGFRGGSARFEAPVVQDSENERLIVAWPEGATLEPTGIHAGGIAIDWDRATSVRDGDVVVVAPGADAVDAKPLVEWIQALREEAARGGFK